MKVDYFENEDHVAVTTDQRVARSTVRIREVMIPLLLSTGACYA